MSHTPNNLGTIAVTRLDNYYSPLPKGFFFAYFPAIGCHSAPADFPQTCTLQESIPSIIEANFSEPALIRCSATCQTEMSCNHTLRLYVPNGAVVIDLPGELSTSGTLFSHEMATAIQWESNATCIAIAEFRILPKSYDLHGSLAMCGVSCQYNSSEMATIYFFEAAFVINLQEQLPTDSIIPTPCHQKGGSPSPEIIAPIAVILFIIIMVLVVVLLVVSFLYMRSRKKSVPYVEAKSVDHDQLALLQVMEVNEISDSESDNERELRVRQKKARENVSSSTENGIDYKLPTFISSRDRNNH